MRSQPQRRGLARTLCISLVLAVVFGWTAGAAVAQSSPATATQPPGPTMVEPPGGLLEGLMFYAVAIATVVSAIGVCLTKSVVRMAVWLFVALGSVAMLYFLLAATFIGAIQLIVYAGGTLILLVFGVMLTSKSPWVRYEPPKSEIASAGIVCGMLWVVLCLMLLQASWPFDPRPLAGVAVADIGRALMTTYVVPFEAAGVLLMIVMVGAAHMARQDK